MNKMMKKIAIVVAAAGVTMTSMSAVPALASTNIETVTDNVSVGVWGKFQVTAPTTEVWSSDNHYYGYVLYTVKRGDIIPVEGYKHSHYWFRTTDPKTGNPIMGHISCNAGKLVD